ncbi:11296_t:CDS:2, partial [Gigaspora rosea]
SVYVIHCGRSPDSRVGNGSQPTPLTLIRLTCLSSGRAIELLASYDKANYASYLLNCFQQDIKHVIVCGSSANFPAKIIKETCYTMTDDNDNNGIDITLNCLIVPIGNLIDIPSNQVVQTITINTRQKIHPGTVIERTMDSQAYISEFFNNQSQPRANRFHVTVYST